MELQNPEGWDKFCQMTKVLMNLESLVTRMNMLRYFIKIGRKSLIQFCMHVLKRKE